MCTETGFSGNFSNRSGKKPVSLYNSGIDDQLIFERMDHRSNAVREYKRPPTGNSFDPHMKCNDAEQIVRQHA